MRIALVFDDDQLRYAGCDEIIHRRFLDSGQLFQLTRKVLLDEREFIFLEIIEVDFIVKLEIYYTSHQCNHGLFRRTKIWSQAAQLEEECEKLCHLNQQTLSIAMSEIDFFYSETQRDVKRARRTIYFHRDDLVDELLVVL